MGIMRHQNRDQYDQADCYETKYSNYRFRGPMGILHIGNIPIDHCEISESVWLISGYLNGSRGELCSQDATSTHESILIRKFCAEMSTY